jgi:hypothetical protein
MKFCFPLRHSLSFGGTGTVSSASSAERCGGTLTHRVVPRPRPAGRLGCSFCFYFAGPHRGCARRPRPRLVARLGRPGGCPPRSVGGDSVAVGPWQTPASGRAPHRPSKTSRPRMTPHPLPVPRIRRTGRIGESGGPSRAWPSACSTVTARDGPSAVPIPGLIVRHSTLWARRHGLDVMDRTLWSERHEPNVRPRTIGPECPGYRTFSLRP